MAQRIARRGSSSAPRDRSLGSALAALLVAAFVAMTGLPAALAADETLDQATSATAEPSVPAEDAAPIDEAAPADETAPAEVVVPVERVAPADTTLPLAEQTPGEASTQTADAATDSSLGSDATITPFATGYATVRVFVGGNRLPDGTVEPVADARLALWSGGDNVAQMPPGVITPNLVPAQGTLTSSLSGQSWGVCTSSTLGVCEFQIPIGTGAGEIAAGTQLWVVAHQAPTGWAFHSGGLGIGNTAEAVADYWINWQYRFRTDPLQAGVVYDSTSLLPDALSSDPNRGFFRNGKESEATPFTYRAAMLTLTTGRFSLRRDNPSFSSQCRVDVALVVDTSGSIGTDMTNLKSGLGQMIDAFRGTDSRISLFSFSTSSPGLSSFDAGTGVGVEETQHRDLAYVTTQAQADALKATYADWAAFGATNWDAALRAVADHYQANPEAKPDLTVLLTDGNPTVAVDSAFEDFGNRTSLRDIDEGIFSANRLKSDGARIHAMGVGTLTDYSDLNLKAVSGGGQETLPYGDYSKVANYAAAATALKKLANVSCGAEVAVQKMIVPAGGDIDDAVAAPAGWEFTADPLAADASIAGGLPGLQSTDATGAASWPLAFASPTGETPVTLHETQQQGYELVPVNGQNAVCVDDGGAPVATTNTGDSTAPGVKITAVGVDDKVTCTFYNKVAPIVGELRVKKKVVPFGGTTADGVLADGWTMAATTTDAGLTITGSPQSTGATTTGTATFPLSFAQPNTSPVVTVQETQQAGYKLLPVNGDVAECFDVTTPASPEALTVSTSAGNTAALPSFDVAVDSGSTVECTFYNIALPANSVEVIKEVQAPDGTWHDANDASDYPQWLAGSEVPYRFTVTNTGDQTLTDVVVTDDKVDLAALNPLPAGLTLLNGEAVIASLAPDDSVTIAYTLTLADGAESPWVNTACVSAEDPADPTTPLEPCDPAGITVSTGSVTWEKVDSATPGNHLAGSEWELTPLDGNGGAATGAAVSVQDCTGTGCAGADVDERAGYFQVEGLSAGWYRLVETWAPAGFVLDETPRYIQVTQAASDVNVGVITNEQSGVPAIPLTGGVGALGFTTGAGLLAAAAATLALWQRRRAVRVG